MSELIRISKKAADAWRGTDAYHQAATIIDMLTDELAHYESMEEQGRLVVLPCAIDSTVYQLSYNRDACHDCDCYSSFYGMDDMCDFHYELYPEINPVDDDEHCPKHFIEVVERKATLGFIVNHLNEFNKTVFVDREEAERVLRGGNDDD